MAIMHNHYPQVCVKADIHRFSDTSETSKSDNKQSAFESTLTSSYEHEVRLFAVCERPFQIENNFCLLKLKHTKSIITSIMLPPLPIPSPHDKKIYHDNLENNYMKLRHILCNNGFKDRQKIHQSRLYDIVK